MAADPPFIVLAALGGLLTGTLADPLIDQFYSDPLLYNPFGRCARCNTHLLPFGALALAGYLRWRGRCPHCGARFPLRSVLLPLATAALFVLTLVSHDDGWRIGLTMAFGSVGLALAATDAERRVLPRRILLPALAAALLFAPFWPHVSTANLLLTGLVVFAVFLGLRRTFGVRLGPGDVGLATLVALVLGYPDVLVAAAFSAVAITGALIVVFAEDRLSVRLLPYGSMLSMGMIFALLWADPIWDAFE